jgi:hypothetical protein
MQAFYPIPTSAATTENTGYEISLHQAKTTNSRRLAVPRTVYKATLNQ